MAIPLVCFAVCVAFQTWEFVGAHDDVARAKSLFKSVRAGWVKVGRRFPCLRARVCRTSCSRSGFPKLEKRRVSLSANVRRAQTCQEFGSTRRNYVAGAEQADFVVNAIVHNLSNNKPINMQLVKLRLVVSVPRVVFAHTPFFALHSTTS